MREHGWDLVGSDDPTVLFKWVQDDSIIYIRYEKLDSWPHYYERYDNTVPGREATWETDEARCAYRQSEKRMFVALSQLRSLLLKSELPVSGGPMTSDPNPTHAGQFGHICNGVGYWDGTEFEPAWNDDGPNYRQCAKCGWSQGEQ